MAAKRDTLDAVIYIMPQRIPKKMLQDIRSAVSRTNIQVSTEFEQSVSHVVAQYTEYEQVVRQLQRDGVLEPEQTELSAQVVSLSWLSACLKSGCVVPVEERHKILHKAQESCHKQTEPSEGNHHNPIIPAWACQRVTPLKHPNEKFTNAIETLEKHAEFRDGDSDYSRALAFHRASCALKSLPFEVEQISQVKGLKDFGSHVLQVMKNIIEDGYSEEVQKISDEWFSLMKLLTSLYGVGPATAKKWISKGWKSIDDIRKHSSEIKDERILWGLAFHEDLTDSVTKAEAEKFQQLVQQEAEAILPGVILQQTGGFRRGKASGHDVDILMTHPEEGREVGLLASLLQALDRRQLVLTGHWQKGTFTPDDLHRDFKQSLRGQLDQFEKWLGICRFSKDWSSGSSAAVTATQIHEDRTCASAAKDGSDTYGTEGSEESRGRPTGQRARSPAGGGCRHVGDDQREEPLHKRAKTDASASASAVPSQCPSRAPADMASADRAWKARRVDLIVAPYSQYFYALVGWTGSKHFNRDLRLYAQRELNMKLSSHGLWDLSTNTSLVAKSEQDVFRNLKLEYRQPWERNC